ncbi:MAG: bifunctional demethylmenaquinone methyltransferase/2-methoxy-6-polyprenyl-1,4-benzoquinol methylase UbiE [Thermodesulfobacteriota bacterium]
MNLKDTFILELFNSISSKYDLTNTILSLGLHYFWKKKAVRLLKIIPGDKIVDICGGTADLSILAADANGLQGKVFLYDFSWAMMKKGKAKVKRKWLMEKIFFIQGNAEKISFKENKFDGAMIGFGLRNLSHIEEGLEEIYRVLKPGGRFMGLEFSQPKSDWFKPLYNFYSFHIIPWLGQMITGSKKAYSYLPESIAEFPEPEKVKVLMEKVGFKKITYYPLTKGVATIYLGIKSAGL